MVDCSSDELYLYLHHNCMGKVRRRYGNEVGYSFATKLHIRGIWFPLLGSDFTHGRVTSLSLRSDTTHKAKFRSYDDFSSISIVGSILNLMVRTSVYSNALILLKAIMLVEVASI